MKHGLLMGWALVLGLQVACATGPHSVRDEGSERIEEAMRPELHPDIIPEGIVLGEDAPPLAPPEPELARGTLIDASGTAFPSPGSPWIYGWVPLVAPVPVAGPQPGTVRYHIEARPGGSIPGLLP
jgi:hypothetical protein